MAENTAGQTRSIAGPTSVYNRANGSIAYDATSITAGDYTEVNCGFTPKKIVWSNDTDRVMLEHREGMADDSAIKTAAAGTRTLEVTGGNGGITLIEGGFRVSQNATLGAIKASKQCRWEAYG